MALGFVTVTKKSVINAQMDRKKSVTIRAHDFLAPTVPSDAIYGILQAIQVSMLLVPAQSCGPVSSTVYQRTETAVAVGCDCDRHGPSRSGECSSHEKCDLTSLPRGKFRAVFDKIGDTTRRLTMDGHPRPGSQVLLAPLDLTFPKL